MGKKEWGGRNQNTQRICNKKSIGYLRDQRFEKIEKNKATF
jgi:hypothetical protein